MSNGIHVTVAAVIERDGRFLMVEEADEGRVVYNQPAGHLEAGESLLDAVRREVLEETAHSFEPQSLLGVYRWPMPGTDKTYIRFCFSGSVGDEIADHELDPDIRRALWLSAQEIRALGDRLRSPMVLQCLEAALQGRHLPLDCLHDLA